MPERPVSRRYARAIFDLAVVDNSFDRWLSDLGQIRAVFDNPELAAFLQSPAVAFEPKRKIVDLEVPSLAPLSRNLAYLLIENHRVDQIDRVIGEFQRMVNDYRGVAVAVVTTAVPLDKREGNLVAQSLADLTGKTVLLESQVDPDIIGGIVARVGDRLIDGSVRTRLAALRRRLSE
jgi:F-type H+-transporting ATPase subunit delta